VLRKSPPVCSNLGSEACNGSCAIAIDECHRASYAVYLRVALILRVYCHP
jgi:hypothetical protein